MAQLSISGAVSNLDTAAIVNQLVSVQGAQQALLRTQQGAAQKAADALKSLTGGVANLGTLARDLAATSAWQGTTASSSSPTVTATASGTRATSLTFDVTSVAAAHTLVSSDAVASTGTVVASGPWGRSIPALSTPARSPGRPGGCPPGVGRSRGPPGHPPPPG